MTWLRLVLAAWVILAGSLPAYAATAANRDLERIPFNLGVLVVVALILVVIGNRPMLIAGDRRLRAKAAGHRFSQPVSRRRGQAESGCSPSAARSFQRGLHTAASLVGDAPHHAAYKYHKST